MLTFRSVTQAKFDNLAQIRRERERWGGSIILYKSAWAVFTFSGVYPRLTLVYPKQNRSLVGLRQSIRSLLLGWWSIHGIFNVPQVLAHNLSGGLDVTRIFAGQPPPSPGSMEEAELNQQIVDATKRIEKRSRWAVFITIATIVILIVAFILQAPTSPAAGS